MTAISDGGNWKDLFKASSEGDLPLIRYHLEQGHHREHVDPNYQHPEYFSCPIFEAIRNGHLHVVQYLVEQGKAEFCNIMEDLTDLTPIQLAVQEKKWDIVEYLNTQLPLEQQQQWKPKQVLVTGGNRGIGQAICAKLLQDGHCVVFTTRSSQAGDTARLELLNSLDPLTRQYAKLNYIVGDLSTIASTKTLAQSIRDQFPTMNVLIHNAGVWPTTKHTCNQEENNGNDDDNDDGNDGLELAFMVHYMAPYILTQELLSLLEQNGQPQNSTTTTTSSSRIILVHAKLYVFGNASITDTPFGHDFHPLKTYMHTKQCGIYFLLNQARTFQEKLREQQQQQQNQTQEQQKSICTTSTTSSSGHKMPCNNNDIYYPVTINAIHPGVFRTRLGEDDKNNNCCSSLKNGCLRMVKQFWKPVSQSADAVVWLATSDEAMKFQGEYFDGFHLDSIPLSIRNDLATQKAWEQWTVDYLCKNYKDKKNE